MLFNLLSQQYKKRERLHERKKSQNLILSAMKLGMFLIYHVCGMLVYLRCILLYRFYLICPMCHASVVNICDDNIFTIAQSQMIRTPHIRYTINALIARFMEPTWGPSGADRTQVGPMLAPWTLPSVCYNPQRMNGNNKQSSTNTISFKHS